MCTGARLRMVQHHPPSHLPPTFKSLSAVLAKRFGVEPARELAPNHPTLGDVDSPEALEDYQAKKRAHKAEMRARRQPT